MGVGVRGRSLGLAAATIVTFVALGAAPVAGQEDDDVPDARDPGMIVIDHSRNVWLRPAWEVGEWWRIRVSSPYDASTREGVLIVGAKEGEEYLVGSPAADLLPDPLLFHVPAMGAVRADDGSYLVHEERFQPLLFPLEEGKTWTTRFERMAVEAQVVSADEKQARIDYRAAPGGVRVLSGTFDADLAMFRDLQTSDGTKFTVVGHGFDYGCQVLVPMDLHFVFDHGAGGAAAALGGLTTAASAGLPTSFNVPQKFQEVAFLLAAYGPAHSTASAVAVSPKGQVFEATHSAADANAATVKIFRRDSPWGDWQFEHTEAGGGIAFSTGVAYRLVAFGGEPATATTSSSACFGSRQTPLPPSQPQAQAAAPAPDDLRLSEWGTAAGAGGLLLFVAAGAWWRSKLAALLWLPLYAKISRSEALDHPVRQQILDLVRAEPGLSTQEIRRRLDLGWGNTVHHLSILERHQFLADVRWGRNRDWFAANEVPPAKRVMLSALRRAPAKRVFDAIQQNPGKSQQQLAAALGVHHGTVLFHARRLEEAHLIRRERIGQAVAYYVLEEGTKVGVATS